MAWAVGGLFAVAACATLDPVGENQCGNKVVESKEDCDGFPRGDGTVCRAPGTEGECHLDCAVGKCPAGWGCGTDGLCREPTGKLEDGVTLQASVTRVMIGDLDGDKRADVLTMTNVAPDGSSKMKAHFFDADGALDPRPLDLGRLGSPSLVDFEKTGQKSIAASSIGANFYSVTKDKRELVPTLNPSEIVEGATRAVPAHLYPAADAGATGRFYLRKLPNRTVFVDSRGVEKQSIAADLGDVEPSSVHFLNGAPGKPLRLFPSSSLCGDILLWATGGRQIVATSPCGVVDDPDKGRIIGFGGVAPRVLDLPPTAAAETIADVHVARGAVVNTVFVETLDAQSRIRMYAFNVTLAGAAQPPVELTADPQGRQFFGQGLVAVEDLDGDGVFDVVTPQVASLLGPNGEGGKNPDAGVDASPVGVSAFVKTNGSWADAITGDFNGDGLVDVVARVDGQSDLDLLSVGPGGIRDARIATDRPPVFLVAGDFDGDGVSDVAYAEATDPIADAPAHRVRVTYGKRDGIPDTSVTLGIVTNLVAMANFGADSGGVILGAVDALGITTIAKEGGKTFSRSIIALGSPERRPTAPVLLGDSFPAAIVAGSLRAQGTVDIAGLPFLINPCGCDGVRDAKTGQCSRGVFFAPGAPLQPTQPGREYCTARLARWDNQAEPPPTRLTESGTPVTCPAQTDVVPVVVQESLHGASADLDGDGVDDVLLAQSLNTARPGQPATFAPAKLFSVQRGTKTLSGDCRLLPPILTVEAQLVKTTALATLAKSIAPDADFAVHDVDRDGKPDLVLVQGAGAERDVVVLFNDGGKLAAPAVIARGAAFGVARLSTDGPSLVVAVASQGNKGNYDLVRVEGRGLTQAPIEVAGKALKNVTGLAGGDIDGDGVDDLAVVADGVARVLKGRPRS